MNDLQKMTNSELKAYIKANRNHEEICHEAIKILINRRSEDNPKYSHDISTEEMEAIFRKKLASKSTN